MYRIDYKLTGDIMKTTNCKCNGTGWVTIDNALLPYDARCDNCSAWSNNQNRQTERRDANQTAYMMRGFGVVTEVKERIEYQLAHPRLAAWPGNIY
jgi:hypothetical protein